jgi:hypothetical protein
MLVAKLRAYEPDVADAIYGLVPHNGSNEIHSVGDHTFKGCIRLRESLHRPPWQGMFLRVPHADVGDTPQHSHLH